LESPQESHAFYEQDFAKQFRGLKDDDWLDLHSQVRLPGDRSWNFLGLEYMHHDVEVHLHICGFEGYDVISVPFWMIVCLFLTGPLLLFSRASQRVRYQYRKRNNLCLHCGYDLRASKDRCPECGKPIDHTADRPSKNLRT